MNILDVTLEQVKSVYSGKPGCGCGCLGTHHDRADAPIAVKRMLNKFQKHERANPGAFDFKKDEDVHANVRGTGSQAGLPSEEEIIFFWETDTRYNWIYVSKTGKNEDRRV